MAHSLSSQQFHNPNSNNYQQCSPSTNSHHATMYNNYHRSHRPDQQQLHGNYQQQQQQHNINNSSRMKLSSLKGKSWQAFGEVLASESSKLIKDRLEISFVDFKLL